MKSALYIGSVVHTRLRPVRHRMRYRLFWMLLDVDDRATPRLFSWNRFNLFSFYERDHLAGGEEPLRAQITRLLADAGIAAANGAVSVLCMPRVLGFVFNPISVFFCARLDGTLAAILYEVNNTFGQRHCYLIPVLDNDVDGGVIRQQCDKQFYVSPFMDMDLHYSFRVVRPAAGTTVSVTGSDTSGPILHASFVGRHEALTDGALLRLALRFGPLSLRVLGAIHWEAIKLLLKGLRLKPRPPAPDHPVSVVPSIRV